MAVAAFPPLPAPLQEFVPTSFCERLIGKGTFGTVYLVNMSETRRVTVCHGDEEKELLFPLAMKTWPHSTPEAGEAVMNEINLLYNMQKETPFVPRYYFYFVSPQFYYLGMEYVDSPDVYERYIKGNSSLSREEYLLFCHLCLKVTAHFEKGLKSHCDYKPQNFLFYQDPVRLHPENCEGEPALSREKATFAAGYCFRIIDLGLCETEGTEKFIDYNVQTCNYRSATQILSTHISFVHDIPSLAAIFFELYSKKGFFEYLPWIQVLFTSKRSFNDSLLQLYYFEVLGVLSQEKIESFYERNKERVERYYNRDDRGVFILKEPYEKRGRRRFAFTQHLERFSERKWETLLDTARQKREPEFYEPLKELLRALLHTDQPATWKALFCHPIFQDFHNPSSLTSIKEE